MEVDRRHFLKLAGLISVGIAVKPVLDVLSSVEAQGKPGTTEPFFWMLKRFSLN